MTIVYVSIWNSHNCTLYANYYYSRKTPTKYAKLAKTHVKYLRLAGQILLIESKKFMFSSLQNMLSVASLKKTWDFEYNVIMWFE